MKLMRDIIFGSPTIQAKHRMLVYLGFTAFFVLLLVVAKLLKS